MYRFPTFVLFCGALTACAPPVHDDPNVTDQVANANSVWAGSKDSHFEGKHNDFIDDLMFNGLVNQSVNLDGLVYSQAPGCAVGVLKNGAVTYLQTYGYADEDANWTFETVAPAASISKTFTSVAAMRMVENGMLELTEPVQTYLGNSGEFTGLTMEAVMSLDANIPAGEPNWSMPPACPAAAPAGASVDWCLSHPRYAFDEIKNDISLGPQADKYSNISFMVAGAVIDQISYDNPDVPYEQRGYEPWVWHELGHWANDHNVAGELTSLALTHSWRDGDIHPYADGFNCNGNCGNYPPSAPAWETAGLYEGWWGPAGGWAMTIGDLARFVALIDNENVLTDESWDELFDDRNNVFGNTLDYGLGTIVDNWDNLTQSEDIVWHGGDLIGHSSVWFYSKKGSTSYGVAMQCNSNGGEATGFGLRAYAQAITDYAWSGGDIYPELDIQIGFATTEQVGGDYVIDPAMAHLVSPKSLHIPLPIDEKLTLRSTPVNSKEIALEFFATDSRVRNDIGTYSYLPRRTLKTESRTVRLAGERDHLALDNTALSIGFSTDGNYITDSKLSVLADLRQLQSRGAVNNWKNLCRIGEHEDGVSCQPCADGVKACMPLVYEFQAERTSNDNPRK